MMEVSDVKLSKMPDGFGYYYANLPLPDARQVNVRAEQDGWRGYVGGEVVVHGTVNKEDCLHQCVAWARSNPDV